jgi:anti-anti-sigma factor
MTERIVTQGEIINGVVVLRLSGELDIYTIPKAREALQLLLDKGVKFLVVDVSDIQYIDSSGIGMLVKIQKDITHARGGFCIAIAPGYIAEFFQRTFLNKVLKYFYTQSECINYIRSHKLFFPAGG